MEFLEYIASLAPEGETFLIVRQKPQAGTYADGLPKCTWPSFLPSARRREGEAWYGNTASFILDRMGERPSASAANCEYVLVLVLDDIGTKSKTPPLPPTWVMETSPGNFQWGYAFTEVQPTKADFSAAITSIADAGYTDAGAINPVRNFRLPGSVNLKPGREGFVSRLVEFHPERQFTLPQICDALGVVPGEAIHVGDDRRNDLFGGRDAGCFVWLWGADVHNFLEVERRLETGNLYDSLSGV